MELVPCCDLASHPAVLAGPAHLLPKPAFPGGDTEQLASQETFRPQRLPAHTLFSNDCPLSYDEGFILPR